MVVFNGFPSRSFKRYRPFPKQRLQFPALSTLVLHKNLVTNFYFSVGVVFGIMPAASGRLGAFRCLSELGRGAVSATPTSSDFTFKVQFASLHCSRVRSFGRWASRPYIRWKGEHFVESWRLDQYVNRMLSSRSSQLSWCSLTSFCSWDLSVWLNCSSSPFNCGW